MKKNLILLSFLYFLSFSLFAQIPAGYYTAAEGKVDAALKTQLAAIISAGAVDKGYDGLYTIYQTSDNLPSGKVWDMYSIKADGTASYYFTHNTDKCGSYSSEGNCYNREHTFCDSWLGAASPQRSDAHHILPTDGYVNNRRSSFPHGKVGTATWTSSNGSKLGTADPSTGYSGTVFEPIDEFKGDFARMYFYVATRYESKIAGWVGNGSAGEILAGNTYPAYKTWFYTMMVQWADQDPVSQKEITRNNAIYAAQKNRNPYIDHPELVDYIWGAKKGQAWSATGGTYPTLSTPTANSTVDFGKIAYQQTAGTSLMITASNLTGDLSFALSGTNAANFSIATTTITKAQAEAGYNLTINFNAQTVGAQSATITITGGGITATNVTLKATSSDEFIAMPATNISTTGFNANWTISAAAAGYSLNVFTMQSSGGTVSQTLLEDDFTSLSAWTAAGYTTATELASYVRLGSSSNVGTITSGAINMSSPTTLLVRAKQYVNDASAKLTVKINNDSITSFLTTATNADYTVDIPAKTSTSTLTLSAAGGSGKRVYVDYVKLSTQGSVQTPVAVSGYPASVGNVLTSQVTSLTPNTTYYYTVTPQGNSAAVSNQIQVTTNLTDVNDALKPVENITLAWIVLSDGIVVRNLPVNSHITLMNVMGKRIQTFNVNASEIKLMPESRGIYILQVQKNQEIKTCKILY
ncbi:MAG: endonuclease [Paludibacter sp.]|nr:endonuclease [Paludibacter sp.]